jgi:hypothetical protein
MAEQTAIQWLIDRYNEDPYDCLIKTGLFAKALEMEKQQIIDAFKEGEHLSEYENECGNLYYKDKFKK